MPVEDLSNLGLYILILIIGVVAFACIVKWVWVKLEKR